MPKRQILAMSLKHKPYLYSADAICINAMP
jgi:hypothetical protein